MSEAIERVLRDMLADRDRVLKRVRGDLDRLEAELDRLEQNQIEESDSEEITLVTRPRCYCQDCDR